MRQLSPAEILSMANMLEMEMQALTVAKTSIMAITDEQLKRVIESGVTATEARISSLQQFIAENNILNSQLVHSTNQQEEVY